jgi:hypothetical protein
MFGIFSKKKEIEKTPLEMVWIKLYENGFRNSNDKWTKIVGDTHLNLVWMGNFSSFNLS